MIHGIAFSNPYNISSEKKPEIIDTVEKNYRISRCVYQFVFVDVADSFIEYIYSLNVDEIQQLDDDLIANGWGTKSLLEIENAYGLLIVPDGEVPDGTEKINLKLLYEMFKDTQSHGLVSIPFLCALGIFVGLNISIPKYALTELYKNLSYKILRGARNLEFEAISNLVGEISFQIKNSNLLNFKKKKNKTKKVVLTLKNHMISLKNQKNLKKNQKRTYTKTLNIKKIEHPYVEPQVQDAETIEKETKKRR